MKKILQNLFSPLLNSLDSSAGAYEYSSSHRTLLGVLGVLFFGIAVVALYFSIQVNEVGGALPVILFAGLAVFCFVVAGLGSDKAVAKVWRNRNDG